MDVSRRKFIIGSTVLATGAATALKLGTFNPFKKKYITYLLSSRTYVGGDENKHNIWVFDPINNKQFYIPVSFYGHSLISHPKKPGVAIMFAQRPGTFTCEVDFLKGEINKVFESSADRHFYGHGVFNADGSLLFSTENDFYNERGVMTVRDGITYELKGEFSTHGAGPHDIQLMADKKTFVVANGGQITKPDIKDGYYPTNAGELIASVCFIDSTNGKLIKKYTAEDPAISFRHLHLTQNNEIYIGLNYIKYDFDIIPPSLAYIENEKLNYLYLKDKDIENFKPYNRLKVRNKLSLTSIDDEVLIVTGAYSPVSMWDMKSKKLIKSTHYTAKGAQFIKENKEVILTTDSGEIIILDKNSLNPIIHGQKTINSGKFGSHLAKIVI